MSYHDQRPGIKIPFQAPSVAVPTELGTYKRTSGKNNLPFHSQILRKGHHQGNTQAFSPNVLLTNVFSAEKERVSSSYNRPFIPQQVLDNSPFQNGNSVFNLQRPMPSPLGMQSGLDRRLPTRPSSLALSQVFCLRDRERYPHAGLRVPIPSLRPVHSPMGFLKSNKAHKAPHSEHPNFPTQLPRRLPHLSKLPRQPIVSHSDCSGHPKGPRLLHQHGEIRPSATPGHRIPGSPVQPDRFVPLSTGGQSQKDLFSLSVHSSEVIVLQTRTGTTSGDAKLRSRLHPVRQTPSPSSHQVDEQENSPIFKGQTGAHRRALQVTSQDLARSKLLEKSSSNAHLPPQQGTHDRRLPHRLVRSPPPSPSLGPLALPLRSSPDKLVRVKGHPSYSLAFPKEAERAHRPSLVRQRHSNLVHQTSGHALLGPSPVSHHRSSGTLFSAVHYASPQTSERSPQRPSRPRVTRPPSRHRVVSGHIDLSLGFSPPSVGSPSGLVRHKGQQPSPGVCVAVSRPSGSRHRRPDSRLEQVDVNLPIPSCSNHKRSAPSSGGLLGDGGPHSSTLRGVSVITKSQQTVSQTVQVTSQLLPQSTNNAGSSRPPQPFSFKASRMGVISDSLKDKGFSPLSVEVVSQGHMRSTQKAYQSVWDKFLEFLSHHRIPMLEVAESTVFNFLSVHLVSLKRKYRTIAKYRDALIHPLWFACKLDINTIFSKLYMRGAFHIDPPVPHAPMPSWSLNTLLAFLDSEHFEPLEEVDLFHLSLKFLALSLLATGRRISEIANLSRDSFRIPGDLALYLKWVPSFKPKNFFILENSKLKLNKNIRKLTPSCPSILPLDASAPSAPTLCPVRAYKIYLKRTENYPGLSKTFLWDHGKFKNVVNIQGLSRKFIKLVEFSRIESGIFGDAAIGPHHCRKLAASYGSLLCNNKSDETLLMRKMGFSSTKVLRKVYIKNVPPLAHSCVLPNGTYIPGASRSVYYRDSIA